MTHWKLGKSIDEVQKERVSYLYNTIYDLTRKKKLICPIADQKEEMWNGRSDCLQVMLELSLGIHSVYSEFVKDYQTRQFMDAFINNKKQVKINYLEFFHRDPYIQLSDNSKFIVSVDLGLLETSDEIKIRKQSQTNKLEKLRQSIMQQGISNEEQLEKEYEAELEAVAILSNKSKEGLNNSDFFGVNDYLLYWNQMNGNPSDFLNFFYSSYYRKIPFHDINCHMSAKIFTGKDQIQSGHKMDIDHASSSIPYVNIFITDRYMKKIICDLELDKTYETLVLNVSELNKLENYFNSL